MISNDQAAAFLAEIEEVCVKHNISISHEDDHGAFLLEPFSEKLNSWLQDARVRE